MAARYGCSAQNFTASRWSPFKFLFMNSISISLKGSKILGGISPNRASILEVIFPGLILFMDLNRRL